MDFRSLALFSATLALATALPGPDILAVVSSAIGRGFRSAGAIICGQIISDLIYFNLAVFGLAALARHLGELFFVIKLAGAGYLIWLGIQLWRSRGGLAIRVDETPAPGQARRGFLGNLLIGFGTALGNPKTMVFYASLLPSVIDLHHLTPSMVVAMNLIVCLTIGLIPGAYGLTASRARRLLLDRRYQKATNRTAGTLMIGAGIAIASQ
jgi:threonine/homoserine/homoserine lactone efflux protein